MNLSGLSFDALPPISLPFRFFITSATFAIVAGAFVLIAGEELWSSRWHPQMLALTHLIVLGVISMVMTGALLQIMPVVGGIGLPNVNFVAKSTHALLSIGTLLLAASFIFYELWLKWLSIAFLLAAFAILLCALAAALSKKLSQGATIMAIRLAIIALALTIILGALIQLAKTEQLLFFANKSFTNLHAIMGTTGWFGLLIVGVSFQVIPMFHVAPSFPQQITKTLPWSITATLVFLLVAVFISSVFNYSTETTNNFVLFVVVTLICSYSLYAVTLETVIRKRKRSIADVTINYWRFSLIVFMCVALLFLLTAFAKDSDDSLFKSILNSSGGSSGVDFFFDRGHILLFGMLLYGVIISILQGILIKILPFLSYTHLQKRCLTNFSAMQYLPNMHELLKKQEAYILLGLHILSTLMFVFVVLQPSLYYLFGISCLLEFSWLLYLMLKCIKVYRKTIHRISSL